jgi:hypothetical protein
MRFIILLALCLTTGLAFAQTEKDTSLYRIETKDGNAFIGHILSQDGESIELETETLGIIRLKRADVVTLERIGKDQIKDGQFWFDNPQSTRYFWQNNGYGLRKGEGYYQNVWVFFNQFTYGITDNWSVGAGIVPLFLFAGAETPVWLSTKVAIPIVKDKFNLGAGGLGGTLIGAEGAGFVFAYGTATLGSRDRNVSLGLGYGLAGGEFVDVPLISLSGMWRTGQRGYLMTENYLVSTSEDTFVMLSFGGRRMIKNAGLDFGLWFPFDTDAFVAIPWLGVSIPFGRPVGN